MNSNQTYRFTDAICRLAAAFRVQKVKIHVAGDLNASSWDDNGCDRYVDEDAA